MAALSASAAYRQARNDVLEWAKGAAATRG
jgi:hypothetical protein